ncbi:DUF2785 domain-containing protein [Anaerorhabdus furcosa]|uniref:DUF2785 domain-containing protein n=1 Tax=Anaerorhabdus furcosa TaxID=118967 RepID=A0A1T4Q5U7_9FIRM|nr:DUF2785 domain-containing protein [Anaerorhabdus furcosa]SJZ99044.1 Protein of unknown function [Anaerorhabdus furcosa]
MEERNVYSRVELSKILKEILEEKIVTINEDELLNNMLFYIGDEDPKLRDKLIYKTFYTLIVERKEISNPMCKELLQKLISDRYLFYRMNQSENQGVLTRSFSVLVVALILHRNRLNPFLSREEFQTTKQSVFDYFKKEKDYRGYSEQWGWIHAIAHCSDAIEEIVLSLDANKNDCIEILDSASTVFTNPLTIFTHEEDERFINAIEIMINRNFIHQEELVNWAKRLEIQENILDYRTFVQRMNGKNMIRSLMSRKLI